MITDITQITKITKITNFDDFCLWMYCMVDDMYKQVAPHCRPAKRGPAPICSDSELLTLALVGECRGWDMETELLSCWHDYSRLFPHLPSQSRFNRRRRNLAQAFNMIRMGVLGLLDLANDRQCALDSVPVAVVKFHRAPCATREWAACGARYGTVSTKKEKIYGYKLHLLTTLSGVILDFELVRANAADVGVGQELLERHSDLTVVADKAYISEPLAEWLRTQSGIELLTLRRSNQRRQLPRWVSKLINQARQIIESVNGQLEGQFKLERNHAHTLRGLCARLYTKLAAHTLCIHLNRLLGNADFLRIKQLAFPRYN